MSHRSRLVPAAAFGILLGATSGCSGPPQIGPDREAFKTIDALYTAVSLREPVQLERCAGTLTGLRDEGRLPATAHDALAAIVTDAKGGRWEPAQSRLREFMLGQHR